MNAYGGQNVATIRIDQPELHALLAHLGSVESKLRDNVELGMCDWNFGGMDNLPPHAEDVDLPTAFVSGVADEGEQGFHERLLIGLKARRRHGLPDA